MHLLLVFALAIPLAALADDFAGRVVGVSNGDTITVLDSAQSRHEIRLVGVGAPESDQPFGQVSRKHLSDLVFGKDVRVEWLKRDRYGHILGKVMVQPRGCPACQKTRDAGLAQMETGLAWWYREYRREQSLEDQGRYEYAEFDARTRRIGLWRHASPVPPWEWRKRNRIAT
ncbi:MAG: thermonuclease family protein [Rhodocyclales bacterium]|nr:thermonuclease family protein [Rhodocyclales bacterium]